MDLKKYRSDKNLTMRQVGEEAGISESYYSMIENGERRPSVAVAKRIAATLGVDWTKFFEEEKSA